MDIVKNYKFEHRTNELTCGKETLFCSQVPMSNKNRNVEQIIFYIRKFYFCSQVPLSNKKQKR